MILSVVNNDNGVFGVLSEEGTENKIDMMFPQFLLRLKNAQ